jgi:hypothetical protein
MIFFLAGCEPIGSIQNQPYPIVTIDCQHINTPYEANIYIEAQDDYPWDSIEIDVEQSQYIWTTQLKNNQDLWSIEMNLINLDCNSKYEILFYYLASH